MSTIGTKEIEIYCKNCDLKTCVYYFIRQTKVYSVIFAHSVYTDILLFSLPGFVKKVFHILFLLFRSFKGSIGWDTIKDFIKFV